jgi:hypothetical protein
LIGGCALRTHITGQQPITDRQQAASMLGDIRFVGDKHNRDALLVEFFK